MRIPHVSRQVFAQPPLAVGAYLTLWSLLEALLRRRAEDVRLPLERLGTSTLLDHLYSQGELSIRQYDDIRGLKSVRDSVAHGFATSQVGESLPKLRNLVDELVNLWWPDEQTQGGSDELTPQKECASPRMPNYGTEVAGVKARFKPSARRTLNSVVIVGLPWPESVR